MNFPAIIGDWLDPSLCVRATLALAHFLWQGMAIALAAALVLALWRTASPRARHTIWLGALVLMALCPFVTLPFVDAGKAGAVALAPPRSTIPSETIAPPVLPENPRAPAVPPSMPVPIAAKTPTPPLAPAPPVAAEPAAATTRFAWQGYAPFVVAAYLLGVVLMLARLALGLAGARRLCRRAQGVTERDLLELLARQAKALRMRAAPALAWCREVAVPTVVGVLRPTVLLPLALAANLSLPEIETILAHELAHVRRYDHLVNLLQRMIEAVLFFHPAVWYVSRQLRVEREHCCDDAVVAAGAKPLHYAQSLLHVAELARVEPGTGGLVDLTLAATGRPSRLKVRIQRLLGGPAEGHVRLGRAGLIVLPLVLLALLAAPALMTIRAEPPKDRREQEQPASAATAKPAAKAQNADPDKKDPEKADGPIDVSGTVVDDETGKAVGQFTLQGGHVDAKDATKITWGFFESRTDSPNPEGRFSTNIDFSAGWRARIIADGYVPRPIFAEPPKVGTKKIENLTVRLVKGGTIKGRVVDHEGKPVAESGVFLVGSRGVNITGGRAVNSWGEGEDKSVTRAVTDKEGSFKITGAGEEGTRIVVSAPGLDLWAVPVPKEGEDALVRLPQAGKMRIRYDIQGAPQTANLLVQFHAWEMEGFKSLANIRWPTVKSGGELVLDNLPPGKYEVCRSKSSSVGDHGEGALCDRHSITVESGKTVEINFVRDRGYPIEGEVTGIAAAKVPGAFIRLKPEKPIGDTKGVEKGFPIFDATSCGADGQFKTERLLPGTYVIEVTAYLPEKKEAPGGSERTSLRRPDFVGQAKVTVADDKPPEKVTIELKAREDKPKAEGRPKAPQNQEKEGFTAWGKEVGGLQAGLGYHPGQKRAYRHGETVRLVVRVRNVGKEEVKFQYLRQFLIESPPAVTDGDGKPVLLDGVTAYGIHIPVEVNLAPGKEIELYELKLKLRPASESGNTHFSTLYGTGKFQIQYERVFGMSSSGRLKLDPNLSKLATGKLELEINPETPELKQREETPKPEKPGAEKGGGGAPGAAADQKQAEKSASTAAAAHKAWWAARPKVDVHGTVVDESGAPIAGANVRMLNPEEGLTARAGSDGDFTLRTDQQYLPAVILTAQTDAGDRMAYFAMPRNAPPDMLLRLVLRKPRELSLMVQDERGRPIAGARVAAIAEYSELADGLSDQDGKATLHIPADAPLTTVYGFKLDHGADYFLFRRPGEPADKPDLLPANHAGPLKLVLSGVREVKVRVVDDQKRPLPGVTVRAWWIERPGKGGTLNTGGEDFHVTTDEAGLAVFRFIPRDCVREVTFESHPEDHHQPDFLVWDPSKSEDDLTATVAALVPVRGRVTYEDGRPAEGAEVLIRGDGYQDRDFAANLLCGRDGSFETRAYPDQYCIFVAQTGRFASPSQTRMVRKGKPVEPVNLVLKKVTRVFGTVTIGDDRQPAPRQQVNLAQRDADNYYSLPPAERLPNVKLQGFKIAPFIPRHATTDKEGKFEFHVGPGKYAISGPGLGLGLGLPLVITNQEEIEVPLHGQRPRTFEEEIARYMQRKEPPVDRLQVALRDAGLGEQQVLLLAAEQHGQAAREFFAMHLGEPRDETGNPRHETPGLDEAMGHYTFLAIDTTAGDPAKAAQGALARLGLAVPPAGDAVFAIVDVDSRMVASKTAAELTTVCRKL